MVFFLYGVVCYLVFFVTFLYLAGFVGNIGVPKGIDSGVVGPLIPALVLDTLLVGLFGLQHSIMARPWFKRWWTQFVPKPIERSTFVLITSLIFILMFWQWRPLPGVIWHVEIPVFKAILLGVFFLGWGLVLYASFLIDHFDLFGVRQVFLHLKGREYTHPPFAMPPLYRAVRNPLMLGVLIGVWATPTMTVGHLMFSVLMTTYIYIGIAFEERDLAEFLGDDYLSYRERTPMLLPWPKKWRRKSFPIFPHKPATSG